MNIHPLIPLTLGLAGIIFGRICFQRWFNHLSLYSLIWGTGLALFELRLMNYHPITVEAWLIFGYAWIAFAIGSVALPLVRKAIGVNMEAAPQVFISPQASQTEKRVLTVAIFFLTLVAFLAVLQHWSVLLNKFGSITSVLVSGNLIYRMRTSEQLPGMVPYLDSFGLAASFFAGVYSARTGKIRLLALLPLLIVILEDVAQVGRAKILNAGILFFSGYFLARVAYPKELKTAGVGKGRRLLNLVIVVALLLSAAEFIRSFRRTYEGLYGVSRQLSKLEGAAFITPSIYMYMSSHPGVFSAYWKAGGEHPFPGSNTFAPVFRILAKFGIGEDVPDYQKFYTIPIATNTATYLRELHADFGYAGILVAPFLLGLLSTYLWLRIKTHNRFVTVAVLAHVYVIVAFTYLYQATRAGYWVMTLLISIGVGSLIDRLVRKPELPAHDAR